MAGDMIPKEQAEADVKLMAQRLAMLFRHFSRTVMEVMGEEKGKEVVARAITRYGEECGAVTRRDVEALGKPTTLENYRLGRDLPSLGWKRDLILVPGEQPHPRVDSCPLADYFLEHDDPKLGRLYCYVDQAKFRAYNPRLKCEHLKNLLDGDPYCELRITEEH